MEGVVELSDVWKVGVASSDEGPPEEFESRFVRIEKLSSVVVINRVDVDCTQSETEINNDEDEKKDQHIDNHVGHGNDDWSSLPPHQATLHIPQKSQQRPNGPKAGPDKSHFISLIRTVFSTLIIRVGKVA